jgi:hypothetical protein
MSGEYGSFKAIQLTAGADLNTGGGTGAQFKAAAVGGTIAATSALTIGLIQNKPKNGEDLAVGYFGHMKGVAGAAITAGSRVMVTTSGYLIAATSGHVPIGKTLAAAASGAAVEGLFDFINGGTISF